MCFFVSVCLRCEREKKRGRVYTCACLLVHVRHCFKLSSYWNGKEWRKTSSEEQATRGGKREREGPLASENPFVISVDC